MPNTPDNGNPLNLPVPHRPGLDDVEYAPKANSANLPPPDPRTGLSGPECQVMDQLIVAANKVIAQLIISVSYTSGPGTGYSIAEFAQAGDTLQQSDLNIFQPTVGHVYIHWPSSKLPSKAFEPVAMMNGDTPMMIACEPDGDGVSIHINSGAGSADAPFTVYIG